MITMEEIKKKTIPLKKKYKADAVYLFGSYARGEATEDSDLDFLVCGGIEFIPVTIFDMGADLREAFNRSVDIYELRELNEGSEFYNNVMSERVQIA